MNHVIHTVIQQSSESDSCNESWAFESTLTCTVREQGWAQMCYRMRGNLIGHSFFDCARNFKVYLFVR